MGWAAVIGRRKGASEGGQLTRAGGEAVDTLATFAATQWDLSGWEVEVGAAVGSTDGIGAVPDLAERVGSKSAEAGLREEEEEGHAEEGSGCAEEFERRDHLS